MGQMNDPEEWVRLFRATLPELYAFAAKRAGGDRALAEDVTQEAWLRAPEAWSARGVPAQPLAWVIHQLCDRTAQPAAFGRLSPSGGTLRPRASLVDLFKVDCGSRGRKAPPGDDLGSSARKPEE